MTDHAGAAAVPAARGSAEPERLLHITHARQDEAWVHHVVIPALGLAEGQYWTRAEDDLGQPRLEELERAVQSCRYTLLIASSAARVDEWTMFAGVLAQHLGLEEGKPRLLVLTRDFDPTSERARDLLPLRQRCLVCMDCSDPDRSAAALATLAAQLALTASRAPIAECPYPGLRMFGTGDPGTCFHRTDLFFGRDDEGREIIDKLRNGGRALLVGPSGCGKSSLVRARVLPALREGPGAMVTATVRPGAHPDVALRAALDSLDHRLGSATDAYLLAGDKRAALAAMVTAVSGPGRVLYIDQLEEVFLDDSPDGQAERAQFFERLTALGRVPSLALLLSMRADFYGDLMRSAAWDDFRDHRVELAPLRGAALRAAITRPAEVCGVHVEVDLVERLVREADQDRAAEALPLLQVALEQLWAHREWRYLSVASYDRIAEGQRRGLDVVLGRHADAAVTALDEPAKVLARRVLIDLVHLGEGRPDTRRRRTTMELLRAGDDEPGLDRVLRHFSTHRLISVGAETSLVAAVQVAALPSADRRPPVIERYVDLAHDTLITGWPALAGWIGERRDDLRTQRRLEARAAGGGLLASSELPEFVRWVAWTDTPHGRELGASEALRTLVRRSVTARKLRIGVLAAFVVGLAVTASIALWLRNRANIQRESAIRVLALSLQESGRQLLLDQEQPLEALPLLVEARKLRDPEPPSSAMRMLFAQATGTRLVATVEHQRQVAMAAFSPDDTRIVTAGYDNTARIWDAISGKPLSPPLAYPGDGVVWSAAFSLDSARVITVSNHNTSRIWDASTGAPLSPALQYQDAVTTAAFTPGGPRVITINKDDNTARVCDASTGTPVSAPLRHHGMVLSATFSSDGTRIVTTSQDHTARVWDTASGEPLSTPLRHQDAVLSAEFNRDGTRVVTTTQDHTAQVWDIASGQSLSVPLRHQNAVLGATFSPDDTRVATTSEDDTVRIWEIASGKFLSLRHQGNVTSAAFSHDSVRVVTTARDHTARIWDATSGTPVTLALRHDGDVSHAMFSRDGTRVVTASDDSTARVWDIKSGQRLEPPVLLPDSAKTIGFSRDGTRIVTTDGDHAVRIWDAGSGKLLWSPPPYQGQVTSAEFGPDGACAVIVSDDRTVRAWDAMTGEPLSHPVPHQGDVITTAFSPDRTRIAVAIDNTTRIWDAASGVAISPPLEHKPTYFVRSVAFSPDGTRVVTASNDNTARVWDATSGAPLAPPLRHQDAVRSAAFSPDGTRIVTASFDHTARIWDAASGTPLSLPLQHAMYVWSAAFSADGARVVTGSFDKTARIWDAASGKPISPPLPHDRYVVSVGFSPDGERIATANGTARIWNLPLAPGTLTDWTAIADRAGPYGLVNGVVVTRNSTVGVPRP